MSEPVLLDADDLPVQVASLEDAESVLRAYRRRLAAAQQVAVLARARSEEADARANQIQEQMDRLTQQHRRHADKMSKAAECLMDKNMLLSVQLTAAREAQKTAESRLAELERTAQVLRQLVVKSYCGPAQGPRSVVETKFWDALATPELLAASQPPPDFPVERPDPAAAVEAQKLRAQLLKKEQQIKALTLQVQRQEASMRQLQESRAVGAELRALAQRQRTQLMGAVRRIRWLLSEQRRLSDEVASKNAYIGKLEIRMLSRAERAEGRPLGAAGHRAALGGVQPGFFSYWNRLSAAATTSAADPEAEPIREVRSMLPPGQSERGQTARPRAASVHRPAVASRGDENAPPMGTAPMAAATAAVAALLGPSGAAVATAAGPVGRVRSQLLAALESDDFDVNEIEGWAEQVQQMAASQDLALEAEAGDDEVTAAGAAEAEVGAEDAGATQRRHRFSGGASGLEPISPGS